MAWLYLDYVTDFLRITPVRQVNKLAFLLDAQQQAVCKIPVFKTVYPILSNMWGVLKEPMPVHAKPLKFWAPDSGKMAQTFGQS